MKHYLKYNKKIFFLLFTILYFQSLFSRAAIYVEFGNDGEVSYSMHKEKPQYTKIQADATWKPLQELNKTNNTSFFNVKFTQEDSYYELEANDEEPVPNTENVIFRIPTDCMVDFSGTILVNSLSFETVLPKQPCGRFINSGTISFKDMDFKETNNNLRQENIKKYGLHIGEEQIFDNIGELYFERKTILSLTNRFLENGGLINFKQEARIVGNKFNALKNKFLIDSEDPYTTLVNKGHIRGEGQLGIFAQCFISENGRIQAKPIVIDWHGSSSTSFGRDINEPISLVDKEFPILDIIRIPTELKQKYATDCATLGEEAAHSFYKKFMKIESFSHKANSQDNGIDVIAYDTKNPTYLYIHEPKNYNNNSFKLVDKNQMTSSWVYAYLFRMYQDFLKESAAILQHDKRQWPTSQYDHAKNVLIHILEDQKESDLKLLVAWVNKKDIPKENTEYLKKEMKNIFNMNASKMNLEDYKAYFKALQIIPRGNSVIHCELPVINDLGFEKTSQATYFVRRNLFNRFKERGTSPQPYG